MTLLPISCILMRADKYRLGRKYADLLKFEYNSIMEICREKKIEIIVQYDMLNDSI